MRSRRPPLVFAAALAAAAAAAACTGGGRAPERHGIEIRAFGYIPAAQAAHPGDTLVFVNHDAVPHTATAANGAWDTGSIPANGTRAVVVPANGIGPYRCTIHMTMTGSIDAGE